jgi:lipopolysaccharide/colanic/teichoic acid biosynthesis glycosyltransferase
MVKRLFDTTMAFIAFLALTPLFAIVAIGIRLSNKGPALYRASRIGRDGKPFTMYKFRTMDSKRTSFTSTITAIDDPRVFPFGSLLRRYKIDELPQLINILKGEMSIVGPRAEDPDIVHNHYTAAHLETLRVLPGLVSPGSLYNYTHGEQLLDKDDPEKYYLDQLLPVKLALDSVYVREASFTYDLLIILRTIWAIAAVAFRKGYFPDPPEMGKALVLIHQCTTRDH